MKNIKIQKYIYIHNDNYYMRGIYLYFLIIPPEDSFCWPKLSQIFTICVVRGKFIVKRDLISDNLVATVLIIKLEQN